MQLRRCDISVAFKTLHDQVNGKKRRPNINFRYRVDGLTVCHCGDPGHLLNLSIRVFHNPRIVLSSTHSVQIGIV
ncbi:MBL fold metallo-hydrolase [Cohnella nanjingensis]|uniref:MBL fold metallo-hydrolase n=1 Tax=Cohnella nanjingensis TaxID=1387779 RepID=UPI0035E44322